MIIITQSKCRKKQPTNPWQVLKQKLLGHSDLASLSNRVIFCLGSAWHGVYLFMSIVLAVLGLPCCAGLSLTGERV